MSKPVTFKIYEEVWYNLHSKYPKQGRILAFTIKDEAHCAIVQSEEGETTVVRISRLVKKG